MGKPVDDALVKPSFHGRPVDERTDAALLLLKGLNPLQAQADADGFGFLSYLLRMAILEAQAIASGSFDESEKPVYDAGDYPLEVRAPEAVRGPFVEDRC